MRELPGGETFIVQLLREAEIFASEARDSADCDQVEIYDIHTDALVVEWIKGVDRKWSEVRAD